MPLSEGMSQVLIYKKYSTGVITANAQPLLAADPGATGGQILRRVSSTIDLTKNTYQSAEIRADRQIADFRHGTRSVTGKITGELSPSSYFDFFEAVHRDTRVGPVTLAPAAITSVAADATASTLTLGGGDAVALGLRVGDIVRLTGMTNAANNSTNFTIASFGTANTVLTVNPAPTTEAAATAATLTRPGSTTLVPTTGHVSRKFAIETHGVDIGMSRIFKENRLAGYTLGLPATGMSTVDFDVMGRDMEVLTGVASPFFTAPTAATVTGVCASVNGLLMLNGVSQGVVTGVNMTMNLSPTPAEVVGQNFAAEVFLGRANLTGTLTAYLQDGVIVGDFLNESEVSLLLTLEASGAAGGDAMSILLPRIKLGGAAVNLSGEGGQTLSAPFQALLYSGIQPGMPLTTVRIHDTVAV